MAGQAFTATVGLEPETGCPRNCRRRRSGQVVETTGRRTPLYDLARKLETLDFLALKFNLGRIERALAASRREAA